MGMPSKYDVTLPVLKFYSDKNTHRISEIIENLSEELGLSPEEMEERLDSGEGRFLNRTRWAA